MGPHKGEMEEAKDKKGGGLLFDAVHLVKCP